MQGGCCPAIKLLELSRLDSAEVYDRAVDVQILRRRRKIEPDPGRPQYMVRRKRPPPLPEIAGTADRRPWPASPRLFLDGGERALVNDVSMRPPGICFRRNKDPRS